MSQRIAFTIDTDASYTDAEKVELLDAFVAFMNDVDGDVVEDSETITFAGAAENTAGITDAQRQEIITEFLQKASITTTVSLDGEDLLIK